MTDEHIDSRKTYPVQRSTLEAIGIELVIAQREYEKQLHMHTHLITGECELPEADEVFYKSQIEYLDGLIKHLHEVTKNQLLLL
jgi:hypothetical protein|tara:strand:- start:118 stop:369 length:252 start_codon:yes stop_codon:yes gene_type:complete